MLLEIRVAAYVFMLLYLIRGLAATVPLIWACFLAVFVVAYTGVVFEALFAKGNVP